MEAVLAGSKGQRPGFIIWEWAGVVFGPRGWAGFGLCLDLVLIIRVRMVLLVTKAQGPMLYFLIFGGPKFANFPNFI